MSILEELQKEFPKCWFKEGVEFDGNHDAKAWSGEGSEINGEPAFDSEAWSHDPHEKSYVMGVHIDLYNFCHDRGYWWEAHDSATFICYPD